MAMRPVAHIALCTIFISVNSVAADESKSVWWPFGRKEQAAVASGPVSGTGYAQTASATTMQPAPSLTPPANAPLAARDLPTAVDGESSWMPSWPAVHMPDVSLPKLPSLGFSDADKGDELASSTNRWYQAQPVPEDPSAWDKIKGGARRARQGTRAAWDKTVDIVTPGDSDNQTPLARRVPPKPPFWKRWLGQDEKPEGPQTVTEWMAQERLNP